MKTYTKEEVRIFIKSAFYSGMTYEEFANWRMDNTHIKNISSEQYLFNFIKQNDLL